MSDALHRASQPHGTHNQAAGGRPLAVGTTAYGHAGPKLVDDGYEPLPIKPVLKAPAPTRWTTLAIDADQVDRWAVDFPAHGVGLRTGRLVGVDLDLLDPDAAHEAERLTRTRLGETPLTRIGRWPKRLLVYRTETPFSKIKAGPIEILGLGQQFVAFGVHPDTGRPYEWPHGDTPLDTPIDRLPLVDRSACESLVAELAALAPQTDPQLQRSSRARPSSTAGETSRDATGRVIDGRDGWLSSIAFHAVHDALDAGEPLDMGGLGAQVWERFEATADTTRPRKDGGQPWSFGDALRKVGDKLRLHHAGRLPGRGDPNVEANYELPTLEVEAARGELDAVLSDACARIESWVRQPTGVSPRIGVQATVGLGKSARARSRIMALAERLRKDGLPHRIIVLTPSHALAEETAAKWAEEGADVAVLRGYEAWDRLAGEPMCLDIDAVRAAILAREKVLPTACNSRAGLCPFIARCAKHRNLSEVKAADVVVAAYDALFTGFAVETSEIAMMLIDEGVWPRAMTATGGLALETLAEEDLQRGRRLSDQAKVRVTADLADLHDLRTRVRRALEECAPGPARRDALTSQGLTADDCRLAAKLEAKRLRSTGLRPGMTPQERGPALRIAASNDRIHRRIALWRALAAALERRAAVDGRVQIKAPNRKTGLHEVALLGVKDLHVEFAGLPILHLDATLRPALAEAVLGPLDVRKIEAAAPHMRLRLVQGRFGKGTLCDDERLDEEERRRRANRLAECVDYVRWEARKAAPERVLVITYKDVESAFAGIPGVETAHFNAIAGLDVWREVRTLIVIGRPLPSSNSVRDLAAAFFAGWSDGRYRRKRKGVRMRDGSVRGVSVVGCEDEAAETMRAAVCDDELIQAIGRGRGVNRDADDPLDVHVLADVALPLVHDELRAWETVRPDDVQRMLLDGVAVDSPAGAAALHPGLFGNAEQARKALLKSGFNRQNPLRDSYRGMSVKSARYRRPGRGRAWQNAYWIDGEAEETIRRRLEASLERVAEWRPNQ